MAHIIVSDLDPIIQYTASGGAQEIFTVPFPFFTDASLDVYLTPVGQTADDATDILTLTTHYTVVGAGNVEGATKEIDLVTPATDGDIITIRRNEPIARSADLAGQGAFSSETYNDEQDLLIMIAQQIRENIGRSIRQGVTGGSWDAESVAIQNVADPVSAQDAVTLNFAQTSNPAFFSASSVAVDTADQTLALTDAGTDIVYDEATFKTVTIDINATVPFPVGTTISFFCKGAGAIKFVATGVATLNLYNGIDAPIDGAWEIGQGGVCSIKQIAVDEWVIFGNTALVAS